jgi:ADP-heptose:LPS heptosyltransferase
METFPSTPGKKKENTELEKEASFERIAQKISEGKNSSITTEEMEVYKNNPGEIEKRLVQKRDAERNSKKNKDAPKAEVNPGTTEKKIFRAALIDTTKIMEAQAKDRGDHMMTETKEDRNASWFKKTLNRIWKHNLAQEYYRNKEIGKAKKAILDSGNLYAGEEGITTKKESDEAMAAIMDRFTSEYRDEMLREEEKNTTVEANQVVNEAMKKLLRDYASTNMSKEAFTEEKVRILQAFDSEYGNKNKMHADNLFEIATEIKDAVAHGMKMEEMDFDINLIKAKAGETLQTEAKTGAFEKIQNSKIGRFIMNEPVVAGVCAGAYALGKQALFRVMRSDVAKIASFGGTAALAGTMSALKENARLNRERAQHARESAKGMVFEEKDMKRREEMEKFRYETINSQEILGKLESGLAEIKSGNFTKESLEATLASLVDLESRVQLGEQKKIDLVTYSHFSKIEQERNALDLARARLKVALRKIDQNDPRMFSQTEGFDGYFQKLVNVSSNTLTEGEAGIKEKNAAFRKMKAGKVAWAFGKTALIGASIGAVVQEFEAVANPNKDGILEGIFKRGRDRLPDGSVKDFITKTMGIGDLDKKSTMLEHFRREIFDDSPRLPFGEGCETTLGNTVINMPEGTDLIPNGDGTYDIIYNGEILGDNLPLTTNPDGSLTAESIALLKENNINADFAMVGNTVSEQCDITPEEYLRNHPGGTHEIKRDLWYDNDTPKPVFDKNELKLWWGGQNGTGVDENGNYVFNVKHMTPDGSYHNEFNVDAQEKIKTGGLKMVFSLSRETQTHVFEVPIDMNGNAMIDKNSELAKLMFEEHDGKALFTGRYAEVAESMRVDDKGIEHVRLLATHEGAGKDFINDTIVTEKPVPTLRLDLPDNDDWVPPPFIPIVGRRPLERGKHPKPSDQLATPSKGKPERGAYLGYNEKMKSDYSDMYAYRNSDKEIERLVSGISSNEKLNKKYRFMVTRIEDLKKHKQGNAEFKKELLKETYLYNRRFSVDKPVTVDDFVAIKLRRLYSQVENIYIENSEVGEKPFEKSFYEKSPLIKGLNDCKEIVVVLDDPIGDAVLTLPLIISINKYLEQNKISKEVRVVSRTTPDLYKYLEEQFPNVKVSSSLAEVGKEKKDRFVFNTNKTLGSYEELGVSKSEAKNTAKVMSVDWASWLKEESPIDAHHMTKYDPLPSRIARTFEIMTGQKLFGDIKNTQKYIEKSKNFEAESKELKEKYDIKDGEKIITISAGSSVVPKEYSPEKWEEVINGIFQKYPNAHILYLEDPDPERKARYGGIMDKLIAEKGYKISKSNEKLSKMNTIMAMSETVITPDTGLGHYSAAMGTKTIMMYLSDPVLWSAPGVKRVVHGKGYETYRKGVGSYSRAWDNTRRNEYYVEDDGVMVGASDISPAEILKRIEEPLVFTKTRGLSSLEKLKPTPVENKTEVKTQENAQNARVGKKTPVQKKEPVPTKSEPSEKKPTKHEPRAKKPEKKDHSKPKPKKTTKYLEHLENVHKERLQQKAE